MAPSESANPPSVQPTHEPAAAMRKHGTIHIGEGAEAFAFIDVNSEKFTDLAWRLRYAQESISKSDLFFAAQVMNSLSHLILQRHWLGKVASRKYFDLVADATLALGVEVSE